MGRLLLALQFLTIIPVSVKGNVSEKEIAQSAVFFPLVGAFQGLLALLSAMVCLNIFSPEITAGLIILILILSNGGFHLDGLADTFDAVAVKSTGNLASDIEKRLAVMKDSATGAIGVIAIILDILLKYLFIKNLLDMEYLSSQLHPFIFLLLMPVASKWSMTVAMFHGKAARKEGLGRIFIDNVNIKTVITSSLLLMALYIPASLGFYGSSGLTLFITLIVVLYIFSFMTVKFCGKKFNGLTGDNLGAISEVAEILFLIVVTIWLRHFI